MNDKLINAWVEYLIGQCGIDDVLCPRKGCPMENYDECKFAQEEVRKIVDEHIVMNTTVDAINKLRYARKIGGK